MTRRQLAGVVDTVAAVLRLVARSVAVVLVVVIAMTQGAGQ